MALTNASIWRNWSTDALLLKALDLGKTYEYATPSGSAIATMKKALGQ